MSGKVYCRIDGAVLPGEDRIEVGIIRLGNANCAHPGIDDAGSQGVFSADAASPSLTGPKTFLFKLVVVL